MYPCAVAASEIQYQHELSCNDRLEDSIRAEVQAEFPKTLTFSDAVAEIHGNNEKLTATEIRETMDAVLNGHKSIADVIQDVEQRLIDFRMEIGS